MITSSAQIWRNALEAEGIDPDADDRPTMGDDLRAIASDLEAKARWLRGIADKLSLNDIAADPWRDVGGEG